MVEFGVAEAEAKGVGGAEGWRCMSWLDVVNAEGWGRYSRVWGKSRLGRM
jgi:hypothetical protein